MSVNFKPEARERLMVIFGAKHGAEMFDRMDAFCTMVRESGEALLVPPDVDQALHEVLSVRPCLELVPVVQHEEFPVDGPPSVEMEHLAAPVEHMLAPIDGAEVDDSPRASVGRTMAELVEIDGYRDLAARTFEVFDRHGFVAGDGECYDQPACTLRYTQPACTLRIAA